MAVATTIDLPGVYRIEEASNKAINFIFRAYERKKIAFVAADVGVIFQPGDVVNVTSANRGVNIDVWVESVTMIDYGRYRVTGIEYRAADFSDEYVTQDMIDNPPSPASTYVPIVNTDGGTEFFGRAPIADRICATYACNAYASKVLASAPVFYYPLNIAADLATYPNPATILDYSGNDNHLYGSSLATTPTVQAKTDADADGTTCSGEITSFNSGSAGTSGIRDRRYSSMTEWVVTDEYTYLVKLGASTASGNKQAGGWLHEINTGGRWTGGRLDLALDDKTVTIRVDVETSAGTASLDMEAAYGVDWRKKPVGFRITTAAGAPPTTTITLIYNFELVPSVSVTRNYTLSFGNVYTSGQRLYQVGLFSGVAAEESALYNTALTTGQLASFKDAWDRTSTLYVDPLCVV